LRSNRFFYCGKHASEFVCCEFCFCFKCCLNCLTTKFEFRRILKLQCQRQEKNIHRTIDSGYPP
jgi:hypothetical protein